MFKENLIFFRKKKGFSQAELANTLNISRQSLSKYETGLSEPSLDKITRLTIILEVSYNELLGDRTSHNDRPATIPSTSIMIQSLINNQLAFFNGFQIIETIPGKKVPPACLLGKCTQNGIFGTIKKIELGWYKTRIDAEREIQSIQFAMQKGENNYQLLYTAKVTKKGSYGIRLSD